MRTNLKLSTNEPKKNPKNKNERSKQLEQEQSHRNGDHMEGYQQGWGGRRMGEKVQGMRSIIGRYKIGCIKNSTGDGEAKERGEENAGGMGGTRKRRNKGEKKWDNCNSMINKIYFKKQKIGKQQIKLNVTKSWLKRSKKLIKLQLP